MKAIEPAFEFRNDDVMPVDYQHIDCHMVFDIKITLDCKFACVVSRDSIRIAFLVVALNDLNVLSADVAGAFLNANTIEKVYTTAGKEFGPEKEGRPVLIVRALYGLWSQSFTQMQLRGFHTMLRWRTETLLLPLSLWTRIMLGAKQQGVCIRA
jgi:hypothetical protein